MISDYFTIPIFECGVITVIGEDPITAKKEFERISEDTINCDFSELHDSKGFVYYRQPNIFVSIYCKEEFDELKSRCSDKIKTFRKIKSTICHESFHAVMRILDHADIKERDEELCAYLVEYVTIRILETFEKHLIKTGCYTSRFV